MYWIKILFFQILQTFEFPSSHIKPNSHKAISKIPCMENMTSNPEQLFSLFYYYHFNHVSGTHVRKEIKQVDSFLWHALSQTLPFTGYQTPARQTPPFPIQLRENPYRIFLPSHAA